MRRTPVNLDLPCELWEGTLTDQGYGTLVINGVTLYAHRVAHQLHVGPLNRGYQVDHLCHNAAYDAGQCPGGSLCLHRRCFNPAHLDRASSAENSARGGHPLHVVRRRERCLADLHDLSDPANVITKPSGNRRCRPCTNARSRAPSREGKPVRGLTIQQPWAWAIFAGKDVENRTQAWSYRGPLAIHAGKRLSQRGCELIPDLLDATRPDLLNTYATLELVYGAIIGVVDLVDVHSSASCVSADGTMCSPWAEATYAEAGGTLRRSIYHLTLRAPTMFAHPIPATGRLGLWTPDNDVLEALYD